MTIIDDLKRLERVGSETSRTTQKLREAAMSVAEKICDSVPDDLCGEKMPRGYAVSRHRYRNGSAKWLYGAPQFVDDPYDDEHCHSECVNGCGGYFAGDFDSPMPGKPSRETVLKFSRDVADGLLGEIADWIEERQQQDAEATEKIKSGE